MTASASPSSPAGGSCRILSRRLKLLLAPSGPRRDPTAVSPAFWVPAANDAAGLARKLADVSLTDLITSGSQQRARFAKYTDQVKFPPGRSAASAGDHDIVSACKPYIQLLVDGPPSGKIPLELGLKVAMEGMVLIIQDGRLMRAEAGGAADRQPEVRHDDDLRARHRDYSWDKGLSFGDRGIRIATVM